MEALSLLLASQFDAVVRDILTPKGDLVPTFYRRVWELNPASLLTVNLDGFARISYADRKTGKPDRFYTGNTVTGSRDIFADDRPLIVNLHGTLDTPSSWVLTRTQKNAITKAAAYRTFLQSIFTFNTVLFYGVDVHDRTVSSQISYLREIEFVNGEYFVLLRDGDNSRYWDEFATPIRPIRLPSDLSWEAGFELFVDSVKFYLDDAPSPPVTSTLVGRDEDDIPPAAELLRRPPDEVREFLARATQKFGHGNSFDYAAYQAFCRDYDLAINHASRVRLDTSNNTWLGYTLIGDLGAGNFGRVFQASKGDSTLAIKVAHESVRDNEVMLNSFRRGVMSMRKLASAKIQGTVGLIDASELLPSIIMQFVEGMDLEKYVFQGRLDGDARSALNIVYCVANTIFLCHTHKDVIFHRDLRPSNIMIRSNEYQGIPPTVDDVVVLDFDLSWFKGAQGAEYYMSPSIALGYLAPEQINPLSKISARSALVDVYGLGMLLYFVLSKEHPVANASVKYDWDEKVTHASTFVRNKDWQSLQKIVGQLIFDCTQEDQLDRIGVQQFIETMEIVRSGYETGFISSGDYVIAELFHRLFGAGGTYTMEYGTAVAVLPSGISFTASGDAQYENITFDVSYVDSGLRKRSSLGKYLNDSLTRAQEIAESFSKVDRRKTRVQYGGSRIVFESSLPTDRKSLAALQENLQRVTSALSIGAG